MGARRSFKTGGIGSIPEVRAGYWWDPTVVTGSGTASFLMYEMNGNTAANMITPSLTVAPSTGTINGQTVVTFTNGAPDQLLRTNATMQRGFTGAQMIWGWVNQATAAGLVFGHFRTNQNFAIQMNAGDCRVYVHDGSSTVESRFTPVPTYANGPFYYEGLYVPSASATNRIQFFIDRVQITPSVAGSPGTSMQDLAEFFTFGGTTSDASNFNYSATFSTGVMGITNGIPTDANRDRMMNFRKLK